jgi:hypothetical protein
MVCSVRRRLTPPSGSVASVRATNSRQFNIFSPASRWWSRVALPADILDDPLSRITFSKPFCIKPSPLRAAEIRALEAEQAASRRRLNDVFQSMLHRAFTGEL